jgi:hypothetical protein
LLFVYQINGLNRAAVGAAEARAMTAWTSFGVQTLPEANTPLCSKARPVSPKTCASAVEILVHEEIHHNRQGEELKARHWSRFRPVLIPESSSSPVDLPSGYDMIAVQAMATLSFRRCFHENPAQSPGAAPGYRMSSGQFDIDSHLDLIGPASRRLLLYRRKPEMERLDNPAPPGGDAFSQPD